MNSKIFLTGSFLLISIVSYSQYDTALNAYDSTYVYDSAYNYEDEDYESKPFESATYNTQDPSQLSSTKQNEQTQYKKENFDKAKWEEIVGETNYNEEKKKEKKEEKSDDKPALRQGIWSPALLKIIGFISIFAIAIAVLFFLVRSAFADDFIEKNQNDASSLLTDDQHIDDVSEQDIDSLLKKALASGDFRSAVRLYYIRLLKHLHTTQFIAWKKDKTNRDYTTELSDTTFAGEFRKMTLTYEIIWYGERTPSAREFETIQQHFNDLHTRTEHTPS